MTRTRGVLAALAIGIAVVAGTYAVLAVKTGDLDFLGLTEEWTILLIQSVWVATPFLVLALARVTRRTPWFVGLVLTLLIWGWFIVDILTFEHSGRGMNFGLGFALMGSPMIIAVICVAIAFARAGTDSSDRRT